MADISNASSTLQKIQDGHAAREMAELDVFMQFFVQSEAPELIGIRATKQDPVSDTNE